METTKKTLVPRSVTLGAELKFFSLEKGATDGTQLSVTFDVPPDVTLHDFKIMCHEQQRDLALYVLTSERLKGSLTSELYATRKNTIVKNYEKITEQEAGKEPARKD